MSRLENKVALVTGGGRGIGRAIAVALAQEGADVAINHYGLVDDAEETVAEIRALGRKAWRFEADVSKIEAVDAMVETLVAETGKLDIAVLNAYFSEREPFLTANLEGFRRTIDVTMYGTFHALRASAKAMVDRGTRGAIVAISSPHAYVAFPRAMAYNMSKAAVDQMCRTAATELLDHKIRVNIVYPGWTDTPGERKYYTEDDLKKAEEKLPWGRLAQPEEIGRAVVFLCDPAADYMTGSSILIDGGLNLPFWTRKSATPE